MNHWKLVGLLLCSIILELPSGFGQSWDAKDDFSASKNPNGAWSYGWSADLTARVTVYPDPDLLNGEQKWIDKSISELGDPILSYNPLDDQLIGGLIPPHAISMHPGPDGQFSHCIWTAPVSGTYGIRASFTAYDTGSPHGYILVNGTEVGDGTVAYGSKKEFSWDPMILAAGDTVDAVVGVGDNGSYNNDSTGFSLTITAHGKHDAEGIAVSKFYGIAISVRPGNAKSAPGFQAQYNNFTASISIDNLEVLKGHLPKRALEMTIAWAAEHRVQLQTAWDEIRAGKIPLKIEPLE